MQVRLKEPSATYKSGSSHRNEKPDLCAKLSIRLAFSDFPTSDAPKSNSQTFIINVCSLDNGNDGKVVDFILRSFLESMTISTLIQEKLSSTRAKKYLTA